MTRRLAAPGSLLPSLLFACLLPTCLLAGAAPAVAPRDGRHDFDWESGSWTTRLQRLREPLSGRREWLDYAGTTVVRPLLGQRANVAELDVQGPAGRIAGVSLRLYQQEAGQWTLHFASLANGAMTDPVTGSFSEDGRGAFYGQDSVGARKVLVRFLILPLAPGQVRFEQAYSPDGGTSWETSWIATDTRHTEGTP